MRNLTKIIFLLLCLLYLIPSHVWAQVVLDDVRENILDESKEDIKAVNEEINRQKKLQAQEKEKKKKAYEERIKRAKKISNIEEKQREVIDESQELIEAIGQRTEFQSEKRRRYEELINVYAEKPISEMSLEEQEETANQFLASTTSDLVELLKAKAIAKAKEKRGEDYEDVQASEELLAQLKQYTQLVKRIERYKDAQTEKIVQKKESVVKSTEELIVMFKEEAIRRAQEKRVQKEIEDIEEIPVVEEAKLKNFEGTVGLHYAYEDNANADTAFEGALFIRNYFAVSWVPTFNKYLKAELGTWYLGDNYLDDQDISFRITTGQTNVKWYPFGNDTLEINPGFEFSDTHYPNNATISTQENRVYVDIKHKFWKRWSQELNYEDSWIANNDNRLARDGAGNNKTNEPLVKRKHSIEYILGAPLPQKISFKLKQKGTIHMSNDSFTDFYDYNSYRIESEFGRSITQRLYGKLNISYEPKYYTQRTVSAHQVAQEDRTYRQKVSFFYFLNDDWLLNYSWTHTKVDSNDPLYDYEKKAHLVGAYYSF